MVKEIIKYPNPFIRRISGNVRFFDDSLDALITDMVDTIKANELNALSAVLIGIDLNVIVTKNGDDYVPYINSRIIKHSDITTKTERSIYYDGISADIDRYEKITVVYEDTEANQHSLELNGDMARLFQEQLDYCFGSTFADRADKDMKHRIDEYLEFGLVRDSRGNESCPIVLYREYFKKAAKYIMLFILVTFVSPLLFGVDFVSEIYIFDKYLLVLVPLLTFAYFFYAKYEAEKYKQCTSCQIGNIIGSIFILAAQFVFVICGVFFWLKP